MFFRSITHMGRRRKIATTKGRIVLVSREDYARLRQYSWQFIDKGNGRGYARRCTERNGKKVCIPMTNEIMGPPPPGHFWDHANGDGMNNLRHNLRPATPEQNSWNRSRNVRQTGGYKGAAFCSKTKKWHAWIAHRRRRLFLGSFKTEEAAARAYDAKAKELHGEFARLNFGC